MQVRKRDGRLEEVKFDKITGRIEKLCYSLNRNFVEPVKIAMKVINGLYDGVSTEQLDILAAETCAMMTTIHPDYAILAARIAISNLQKNTDKSFSKTMKLLYDYIDPKTGEKAGLIGEDTYQNIKKYANELNSAIIYDRDFNYDYFGFKTLEKSYLLKLNGKIAERPQHMLMRVAVGIHQNDLDKIIETYNLLSEKWFTHATPTLFNAGTPKPQMSSCFVAGTQVFTVNAGIKNIENVEIGDLVITHKGNVKPVIQLHKNPLNDRQIYDFKVYGSPNLQVTGNHKFWSISKEQNKWGEEPQWNSVEYLREGDYIAIPKKNKKYEPVNLDMTQFVPKKYADISVEYTTDNEWIYPISRWERPHKLNAKDKIVHLQKKHNALKKNVLIDKEFAFFLGVWIGDGHIITGKNLKKTKSFIRGIGLTFHTSATKSIQKMKDFIENTFGITPKYHTTTTNTVSLLINSHIVGNMFETNFGQGFNHKKLPSYVYDWDYDMVKSFMEGLTTSDGCVTKDGDVRIAMANHKLVKSIYALCRNVGIALSYSASNTLKRGATECVAYIALPKQSILLENVLKPYKDDRLETMKNIESKNSHITEINGQTFLRISKKVKSDLKPEFVYTLGVQDDHSYTVEGVICENCFLLTMKEDSISGIYDTLKQTALISQSAGGIGISMHNIRATGSYIRGTNGHSNGIVPMLRVFNDTARYVDQGGNKRKGAVAIYLEPWHADVFEFLELKKNHGKEEVRARDLFYALWISDLFMQRVENDDVWSLFCPNEAKGLSDVWGKDFEELYERYEREGKARKVIKAQDLWHKIVESQIETGTPYMLYKDSANRKSNQQNLGTIKSSNLCSEIIEYTSPEECAVCNLASIALPRYVQNGRFDHQKLFEVTQVVTKNLNKIIDLNYYPIPEAQTSNMRHRPIGIGVQGLADVFAMLRMPFDSDEAKGLNKDIFETIYFGAMSASVELAKAEGTYQTYQGSPLSQGKFQFDLWGVTPDSGRWDWENLRKEVLKHGARNSLLLAPMPTASTSQILGNNECFEPFTSNVYNRRVLAGEFPVVNRHLLKDLIELNLWNENIKNKVLESEGSIQNIPEIPQNLKDLYKTVWEIKQKAIIDMAADRGVFICQSQSLNIHLEDATFQKLTSMHFYAWKRGLKTGMYYLRTRSATQAIKFTVQKEQQKTPILENVVAETQGGYNRSEISQMIDNYDQNIMPKACSLDDPDCEACSA